MIDRFSMVRTFWHNGFRWDHASNCWLRKSDGAAVSQEALEDTVTRWAGFIEQIKEALSAGARGWNIVHSGSSVELKIIR